MIGQGPNKAVTMTTYIVSKTRLVETMHQEQSQRQLEHKDSNLEQTLHMQRRAEHQTNHIVNMNEYINIFIIKHRNISQECRFVHLRRETMCLNLLPSKD